MVDAHDGPAFDDETSIEKLRADSIGALRALQRGRRIIPLRGLKEGSKKEGCAPGQTRGEMSVLVVPPAFLEEREA